MAVDVFVPDGLANQNCPFPDALLSGLVEATKKLPVIRAEIERHGGTKRFYRHCNFSRQLAAN
jgi:hypothetical protein